MTASRDPVQISQERGSTHRPLIQDGQNRRPGTLVRETVPIRAGIDHTRDFHLVQEPMRVHDPAQRWGGAVRILFGLIWLMDAYFKWQPSFLHGLLTVMHNGTMGQPAWLMPWFTLTHSIVAVQPTLFAHGIAIMETGLALAVLFGVARKVTYLGGVVWSLLIWSTAEGFGRTPPGSIATDIGTAIVYAAVFLALLAADQCAATRPYSLDAVLERRLPGWQRLAECGGGDR